MRVDPAILEVLEPHVQPCDVNLGTLKGTKYFGTISELSRRLKPKSILEFGVRFGYSAVAMLWGQGGTADYCGVDAMVDGRSDTNGIAERAIRTSTIGAVRIIEKNTADPDLLQMLPNADLVFVDADHANAGRELALAMRRVNQGGMILIDDVDAPEILAQVTGALAQIGSVTRSWIEHVKPAIMVIRP